MASAMRFERLDDWLHWLESHHPTEIELGLARIRVVAERLDLLTPHARVISVAGTNGKGSCVEACAALLRAAGQRVGAYTSPHLQRYNERVRVDGVPVSDDELCRAFARIDAASTDTSLTYFEFGTLAALLIFRDRAVDVMVLEVGLGGRLDAVNLLDADAAVVTSVDLDHQAWLGDNRDSIGREKAGIYRAGQIALCADDHPPEGLLVAARERGVALQRVGEQFGFAVREGQWCWWGQGPAGEPQQCQFERPVLPWPSLAAALQVVAQLGYQVEPLARACELGKLTLPGRYQVRPWEGRTLILDVAHNPAAARHLADRLADGSAGDTHVVIGMMADKDRVATLAPMAPIMASCWLVSLPAVPRAATVVQLAKDLEGLGVSASGCGTVAELMARLRQESRPGDRIVVMGSFYTVSAALDWFEAESAPPGPETHDDPVRTNLESNHE